MEKKFLLTRPSRDVTNESGIIYTAKTISTHTPLAGRDIAFPLVHPSMSFLLTRPSRDVTQKQRKLLSVMGISTHTPLAGRDLKKWGITK